MRLVVIRVLFFLLTIISPLSLRAADVQSHLKTLRSVGPMGAGHREATAAWQELAKGRCVAAHDRAGGDRRRQSAGRQLDSRRRRDDRRSRDCAGRPLPLADLERFVLQTKQAPQARRMAFEWLTRADATAPDRLIPGMLDDPSVEFRRDAVKRLIDQADPLFDAKKQDEAAVLYRRAMQGARDLDQIQHLTKRLRELEQPVDLQTHFGFLTHWKLIAPFDNTEKKGYDVAYPPERAIDFSATYEGKAGPVGWIDHVTQDDYGMVDFNKAIGKHMGVVGYAAAEYESPREQTVELRLGCINANKLWLNGEADRRARGLPRQHAGRSIRTARDAGQGSQPDPGQSLPERADRRLGPELAVPAPRLRCSRDGDSGSEPPERAARRSEGERIARLVARV